MDEERNEVWGRTEDRFEYNLNEGGTFILINGAQIPVEPGSNFRTVVGENALNAGFNKYRVFLNGEEIRPSLAPENFNLNDRVEIRAYDNAGNVVLV